MLIERGLLNAMTLGAGLLSVAHIKLTVEVVGCSDSVLAVSCCSTFIHSPIKESSAQSKQGEGLLYIVVEISRYGEKVIEPN